MKHTFRTWLCALLAACMLIGMLPAALAEDAATAQEAPSEYVEEAVEEVTFTLDAEEAEEPDAPLDVDYETTPAESVETAEAIEPSYDAAKETRTVTVRLKDGVVPTRVYDGTANCGYYTGSSSQGNLAYHALLTVDDFVITGVEPGDVVEINDDKYTQGGEWDGAARSYLERLKFDSRNVPASGSYRTVAVNFIGHLKFGENNQYYYVLSGDSVRSINGLITPKTLTVTPRAATKVFGAADPTSFGGSISGLLSGDSVSGKISREPGENVGTYRFTPGTLSAGSNYEVRIAETPVFTITPRPINAADITVSSIDSQKYTGSAICPELTVIHDVRTLVKGTDYTVTYTDNVSPGRATVTITGIGNYNGTRMMDFNIIKATPSTPIWLVPEHEDAIGVKETLYIQGAVSEDHPEISDRNWKWASSNKKVATVKAATRGAIVTGKKAGTTTITATTPDKRFVASYVVQVVDMQTPTSVRIDADDVIVVGVKDKMQLNAVMTAIGKPKSKLTWKSSNTKVATVSGKGLVTGKKAGTATITVTTENKLSDSVIVEVQDIHAPTSVAIKPAGAEPIDVKGKRQLTASMTAVGTPKSKLKWKSSNTKVASVSAKGFVTGKKPGKAVITVTTDNKLSDSIEIEVRDIHAPISVTIEPANPAPIAVKGKLQLTAAMTAIGTPKSKLKWKSSNTKVATVSGKGLVTGKKPGTAVITVTTGNNLKASVTITVK